MIVLIRPAAVSMKPRSAHAFAGGVDHVTVREARRRGETCIGDGPLGGRSVELPQGGEQTGRGGGERCVHHRVTEDTEDSQAQSWGARAVSGKELLHVAVLGQQPWQAVLDQVGDGDQ